MADSSKGAFKEAGVSGLRRSGGFVQEEFLPQLAGYRAIQVYREMLENDPVIGAIMYAIDKLIRQVSWTVNPATTKPEDVKAAKFVESCMYDMSHTWDDTISEILSMLGYGWSMHEIVYKKRDGMDGASQSKYSDGAIGWRKMPIRSQETRQEWVFDDAGGIVGMNQSAPPKYEKVFLPIEKCLLFRTTTAKNNPEGRSVLRNAYRPWYFKKRIEEIEAIGVERDLAGFPIMYVDPDIMQDGASDWKKQVYADYKTAIINIRRDQQEGLILPSTTDEHGHQLYRLELLSAGGSRQFDTNTIISRYDQRIASTVLADFILLGQNATGSYALSNNKTDLFHASLRAWLEIIASVFNAYAIPRLFKINGFDTTRLPELAFAEIAAPPLTEIGTFIQQLAGAGAPLFPDDDLENYLRGISHLPERPQRPKGEAAPQPVSSTQQNGEQDGPQTAQADAQAASARPTPQPTPAQLKASKQGVPDQSKPKPASGE